MKEIGLSFLVHIRADRTKQGASRKMRHIHTRFLFIQELVFRKLLTTSAIKADVDPSDIGTITLERERSSRIRATLGLVNDLVETRSLGSWDDESCEWIVCRVLRVETRRCAGM